MLTSAEVALLLRLVPGCRELTVLDWRNPDQPCAHDVFVRAWAPAGFVVRRRHDTSSPGPQRPILLIRTTLPEGLEQAGALVVRESDGRLLHEGEPLDLLPRMEVRNASTSLVVQGKNEVALHEIDLPCVLRVRPGPNLPRSVIGVRGNNPFDALPPPRWFRLQGGPAELTIDVQPGRGGDHWDVRASGEEVVPVADPAARAVKLTTLGLVFDRTCPDRNAWSDARGLVLGPTTPQSLDPAALNRAVREGLAGALRDSSLSVHLAWFADGADPVGDGGTWPAGELADLLSRCTYVPGLELWGPLEDALALVAGPLLRQPRPGTGIMIVGNSPPGLPLDVSSPFWRLLQFRGAGTTARRKNATFTHLMRDLEAQGVPVVYLFLTHDLSAGEEASALNVHQALYAEVQEGLRHYLKVIAVPADGQSVVGGVAEALAYLAGPPPSGAVIESP